MGEKKGPQSTSPSLVLYDHAGALAVKKEILLALLDSPWCARLQPANEEDGRETNTMSWTVLKPVDTGEFLSLLARKSSGLALYPIVRHDFTDNTTRLEITLRKEVLHSRYLYGHLAILLILLLCICALCSHLLL